MAKVSHTPGPWKWNWRVSGLEADCGVYSEDTPGQAVSVCRAPRYESRQQWEANARLISAAPALLEALEHLVSQVHFLKPASSVANCTLSTQEAEAVIRLAKGGE